ncbi:GntR family transcriptional regulator [Falsiroseomonas selenitidurans]|uniref:GntR family transcriptional regulator n=1 Tax=Falsiroseomonas selenitidurans TaxID=2716335 RepID=A0ABX1E6J1_9PROT|nr:GntR family transcriptional regulator [Falsiroseomonas selenitidurans]NKC31392.1 GntR family transcriptional regulator [Falsiroseomonas selenitidurans]
MTASARRATRPQTAQPAPITPASPGGTRGTARAFVLRRVAPLDPNHALPLYMQLAERFVALIGQGQDALVGQSLPTESECMAHFGISRPTVRQAMAQLASQGLITRGRGRGTFVAPRRLDHDLSLAFEDEARNARKRVSFQLLDRRSLAAPPAVLAALSLPPGTEVEVVERLRLLDGEVFGHELRYLPPSLAERVTSRMLERQPVNTLLRQALGEAPKRMRLIVRSVPAEARIARLLGVKRGTPLLESEHVYRLASGAPVLCGFVRFHGDRFQFTAESEIRSDPQV